MLRHFLKALLHPLHPPGCHMFCSLCFLLDLILQPAAVQELYLTLTWQHTQTFNRCLITNVSKEDGREEISILNQILAISEGLKLPLRPESVG